MNGPVSGQSNFSGWLRKQPKDFQDEYFSQFPNGKARAKLFRNGGLSMDKFTDNKSIVYTLDELKALEPQAFERANIQFYNYESQIKLIYGHQTQFLQSPLPFLSFALVFLLVCFLLC